MVKYRRLARVNIYRAQCQLARSLNQGNYTPLERSYYRRVLEHLALAQSAFDKADRLSARKDRINGGRTA